MARQKNRLLQIQVGERLAAIRNYFHLGQLEIAAELKISKQCWSNYETGKRSFDIDVAVNLCRRKNVPLDWVYFGKLTKPDDVFVHDLSKTTRLLKLQKEDKARRKQGRVSTANR